MNVKEMREHEPQPVKGGPREVMAAVLGRVQKRGPDAHLGATEEV